MTDLDIYKINSNNQDTTKVIKAEPLPVKQQDYYDFNTPEEAPIESPAPEKGVLLPFKKNAGNSNAGKKSKKDSAKGKKDKKKNKKEDPDKKTKEKNKKEAKKTEKNSGTLKEDKKKKELKEEVKEVKVEKTEAPKAEVAVSVPSKKYEFFTREKLPFDFKYLQELEVDKAKYVTSLFKGHDLKIVSGNPILRETYTQDWILLVILFVLLSISWLKAFHYKKLKQYFSIFFKERITGQVLREEKPFSEKASVQLFVSGLLSLSLFLFQIVSSNHLKFIDYSQESGLLYLKILGLLAVLFGVKILSLKITGHLFMLQKMATEYIYTVLLFFNILGVLIVPLIIGMQYMPLNNSISFIYAGAVLTGLIFIYGLYRGVIIGAGNSTVSNFYLFIYLCTLEILPLLVVFKVLLIC